MNVTNSNSSYRRGVLLGLTMAELIVLIVFLLLLAFAVMLDKEKKANATQHIFSHNREEIERIIKVFSSQPPDLKEDVVRVVEKLPSVISLIKEKDLRNKDEAVEDTIVRALEKIEIEKNLDKAGEDMPAEEKLLIAEEKIKELEADAKNLTDQKKNLITQIESKGRGVDMPPCWPDSKGRATEYLFNVDLTNAGITLFDAAPTHRVAEKARLPLGLIKYGQSRSISQFYAETKAVSDWSRQKGCRFYVFVRDKTGASEKALFKQLLIAVEGPFYKKLSNSVLASDEHRTKKNLRQDEDPVEEKDNRSFFNRVMNSKKQAKTYN